ncbi:flagellin [Monaibacterium marinum]|uniref:flagellin n=1 Tax=Pontivivens marinum TaxID=1690039 RepID=UPI001FE40856|nr:flagellin [Monaibacterium marinum]
MRSETYSAENELLSGRVENVASLGASSASRVQRINLDLVRADADQQSLSLMMADLSQTDVTLAHVAAQTGALSSDFLSTGFDAASVDRRAERAEQVLKSVTDLMKQPGMLSAARIVEPDALLAKVSEAMQGSSDPAAALSSYFERGGGFDTDFPLGQAPSEPMLSNGQIPSQKFDLNSDEIRTALAGYTAFALADDSQAQALSELGSKLLLDAQDGITSLRTQLGSRLGRVEDLQTATATRETALNIEKNALDGVDPYEAATRLQAYQDKMDMVLVMTRRMSDLSLAKYL